MPTRSRIPNISIPSRGAGRSIPSGFIIGRASKGRGRLELLDLNSLAGLGIGTNKAIASAATTPGFGFTITGKPGANQLIGSGTWAHPVTFQNGLQYAVTSLIAATTNAVFSIKVLISGVYTTIGTITFSAGSTTGVVNFPSAYTVGAGVPISLWAPTPQDATLANITGSVDGTD